MGGLSTTGISQTGEGLAFATPMRAAGATWYGPGLYGNRTACDQVLRPGTVGVAHRSLPCGTAVKFAYRGRQLVTTVIDRGPYSDGHAWDLTNGARQALGFEGSNRVLYALAVGAAAKRR
jgi:peptidoglycan lytic transglycosylase